MSIPSNQLLGASIEPASRSDRTSGSSSSSSTTCGGGKTAVRLWYCTSSGTAASAGHPCKRTYKVHQSEALQCASPEEAEGLALRVRRSCAWWGRSAPPHVVIVVNPASGTSRSQLLMSQTVLPMLRDAAGLTVAVHQTSSPGDATAICAGLALKGVDLLLFVGGDGTIFEGLQGLLGRPDWQQARLLPIAALPAGSGNGLAGSTGLWDPVTACFAVTRGRCAPLDIASVLQLPHTRYFIFLSLVFGVMSNLDIGTEHLRWMGEIRFTLGGLKEILSGAMYHAHVTYLPASQPTHERSDGYAAPTATTTAASQPSSVTPCAGEGDSCGGTTAAAAAGGLVLSSLSNLEALLSADASSSSSLHQAGWRSIPRGDTLQLFGLYNTQYVALSVKFSPQARLASGCWELMYTLAQGGLAGRLAGLEVLTKADEGTHILCDFVHTEKVRALLFTPVSSDTWTVLDGEAVPRKPLAVEVHPGLCSVLVGPDWSEE
ncbi:MAG: hypothetical protein WDW36_002437 [Sanguina aurantia]